VTRQDLVQNFQDQIETALLSTEVESGPTPEFQIEFVLVRGKMGVTFLYRLLTSTVQYAEILNAKMARIMPGPSPMDICYIKYQLWGLLPNKKKIAYYAMQKSFKNNQSAMRLKGVKNPHAMMGQLNSTGTTIQADKGKSVSVFTWLTTLQAADGFTMFPKVLPCRNGQIELWHNVAHTQEVKAWATTALTKIARLSQISIDKDRKRAEELFTHPEKVMDSIEKMKSEVSVPTARSVLMDFQPTVPNVVTTSQTGKQGHRHQSRRPRNAQNHVKLVFDLDEETAVSALTTADAKSASTKKSSGRSRPPKSATEIASGTQNTAQATDLTEEKLAKSAAAKAIETANALTNKFPAKGKSAYEGACDIIEEKYGNRIPVVENSAASDSSNADWGNHVG
jgi:hypothetical protein